MTAPTPPRPDESQPAGLRNMFAARAPISYDVAAHIYGEGMPSDDRGRAAFFAVWALLCFEWADAMLGVKEQFMTADPTPPNAAPSLAQPLPPAPSHQPALPTAEAPILSATAPSLAEIAPVIQRIAEAVQAAEMDAALALADAETTGERPDLADSEIMAFADDARRLLAELSRLAGALAAEIERSEEASWVRLKLQRRATAAEAALAEREGEVKEMWGLLEEIDAQLDLEEWISTEFAHRVQIALWGKAELSQEAAIEAALAKEAPDASL